jgi:hypothetical protein
MPMPSKGPWENLNRKPGNFRPGRTLQGIAMKRKAVALALALSLASPMLVQAGSHEIAKETDDLAMIWDLLIIRPLSLVAMVAGAVFYIPAALVTEAGNNDLKPIKDTFLRAPYKYAIERPLGHFNE